MACGLGAVALMLVFIKESKFSPLTEDFKNEIVPIEENIDDINNKIINKNIELNNLEIEILNTSSQKQSTESKINITNNVIQQLIDENNELSSSLAEINKESEEKYKPVKKSYISGCNVTGKKIILLLDSSQSMLHKELVQILRLRMQSDVIKQNTQKWNKAKDIYRWLAYSAPSGSSILLAKFDSKVTQYPSNTNWIDSNNKVEIEKQIQYLLSSPPDGGTNLYNAIDSLKTWSEADSLYLVTDGLPTLTKSSKNNNKISRCLEKDSVSSECRELFFDEFAKSYFKNFNSTKFNTILLPMVGDPNATFKYALFSKETNGCFVTSSADWPL
tara:strand:- start:2146 stop:3138 length:993 start_codon:yes stop_codon:yes gene_type:complete